MGDMRIRLRSTAVLGGLLLLAACGDSGSPRGDGGSSGGDDGGSSGGGGPQSFCDELLGQHGADKCLTDDTERCTFVAARPDARIHWTLVLPRTYQDAEGDDVEYTDEEHAERRECLAAEIARQGGDVVENDDRFVGAEATHEQMQGLLDLEAIRMYELHCIGDDEPCDCIAHDLDGCPDNPFCHVLHGDRWDPAGACVFANEPAGCERFDLGGGGLQTIARDPDGNCWLFPGTEVPRQPGWESGDGYSNPWGCDGEAIDDAPECP